MSGFPLLTIMMVVPLVGAAVVALLPGASARLAKPIALRPLPPLHRRSGPTRAPRR